MARIVVLRFEDNDEANEVVAWLQNQEKAWNKFPGQAEVLGLLPLPTQFCDGMCATRNKKLSFARGKKYGWWVCTACMKPSQTTGEKLWRAIASQATNLLQTKQEPLTGFEEGWGVSGR